MSTAIIDAKLYASFFLIYHLMKTFTAVKINEAVGKKNLKGLKDKVCGSYRTRATTWNLPGPTGSRDCINIVNLSHPSPLSCGG